MFFCLSVSLSYFLKFSLLHMICFNTSPHLALQYCLYPISASLLLWNGFSCGHNGNWQDTLLSTALVPPSLLHPPYFHPFFHLTFNRGSIFFSTTLLFVIPCLTLSLFTFVSLVPSLICVHFPFGFPARLTMFILLIFILIMH